MYSSKRLKSLYPYISYFAQTDFRNSKDLFGIYQKDRLNGMYLLGKTGSGKTNLMKVLMYQDVVFNRGFCLFDVNGDVLKEVLELIPKDRKKDVVLIDTANPSLSVGYNPLRKVPVHKRALIASSLLETFQKIWGKQAWGLKLEYILRYCFLTLLDQPQASFENVSELLLDKEYRNQCLTQVSSKQVRQFWIKEYPQYSKGDILPVLNKIGSFISIPILKKILVDNTEQISLRKIMDEKKILLVNLSKGSLGMDGANLLGSFLLTALSSAAFTRIDTKEENREPFFVYLDEFQNYTTQSLVNMFAELRKFRLGFVIAHQYLNQLSVDIKNSVLGNVGTIICFKLGQQDAKYMSGEFYPIFQAYDFVHLKHYHIYLKLLINGGSPRAFSAKTIQVKDIAYNLGYLY